MVPQDARDERMARLTVLSVSSEDGVREELAGSTVRVPKVRGPDDLDRLWSVLAHDTRGALASFASLSRLLEAQANRVDDAALRSLATQGDALAMTSLATLENVICLGRSIFGVLSPAQVPVRAIDALARASTLLASTAEQGGVAVSVEGDPNLVVLTDPKLLEVVLRNLASNAVRFTPRGAAIYLVAVRRDESAELWIRDEGVGISPDILNALSSATGVVEATPAVRGERGPGLGLAVSRALAEAMGGHLSLESQVGEGTTARLVLPALPP